MNSLDFKPMLGHERGTILRMLQDSYAALPQIDAKLFSEWESEWRRYDDAIFDFPGTVGACGFVTYCGDFAVGFASWDPRQYPVAIIGHNCILPVFRGNGYGVRQIEEEFARFAASGFGKVRVTTGDHAAFVGAQRMYLACGMRETRRFAEPCAADGEWGMIEYEKDL